MHVFISYAHVDEYRVWELVEILRASNHDPWFDHRLVVGRPWDHQLLEAVLACERFLYALTPESVASRWCQWEFAQAVHAGKPIVPVLIQETPLPDVLRRILYADFSKGPTPVSVAKLIVGVLEALPISPNDVPLLPVPSDKPERPIEAGGRILRVEDILPPPFEWADIPAGAVTLEDASNHAGTKGGQYNVSAFAIAKYPITNEQYEVFVDANDGYRKLHWWEFSKEAKKWRKENPQPAETRFRGDDLPRTIVCWYDAVAFCQWLSHTTGQAIALPAEQQWQRAAQGDDGRKYPWGDEFDASRCNIQGSGIEEPTPVTQYPNGASPYGVMDMSGNVWEWCLTAWRTDNSDLRGNSGRVLRGGSWNVFRYFARSLNRDWFFPYTRLGDIGFRVVCASPITFRSFGDHLAVC